MYSQTEIVKKYGLPNKEGIYLRDIVPAYPLKYGNTIVKRFKCHHLEVDNLTRIFEEILDIYGLTDIEKLRLNRYGGCFNYRVMTGNKGVLSRHCWGVAIDMDPQNNAYHQTGRTASFARPEYELFLKAFENHGWCSLGKHINKDWMHFEACGGGIQKSKPEPARRLTQKKREEENLFL
jgi:hypothetical protein